MVTTVVELAGDVPLGQVQTGVADALPDTAFVRVHRCGVDVPVADMQRGLDGIGCFLGRNLKHPNPNCVLCALSGSSIRGTLLRANLRRIAHGVSVTL